MSAVVIRPGGPADWPCFRSRWYSEFSATFYTWGVPHQILQAKLDALLASPLWALLVACPQFDHAEIMGLLLYKPGPRATAAWLTVKEVYRNHGTGTALLAHAGLGPGNVDCAFVDPAAAKRAERHGYKLRFRPYLCDVAQWDTLRAEVERDAG